MLCVYNDNFLCHRGRQVTEATGNQQRHCEDWRIKHVRCGEFSSTEIKLHDTAFFDTQIQVCKSKKLNVYTI